MSMKLIMTGTTAIALMAGAAMAADTEMTNGAMDEATMPSTTMGAQADVTPMMPEAALDMQLSALTVDEVLGMNVENPDGNDVGEIDYVIRQPAGPAAVIGIGGFLGLGEYTVALPLTDFSVDEDGDTLIVATDEEVLEQMPEIDEAGLESVDGEILIADLMPQTPAPMTPAAEGKSMDMGATTHTLPTGTTDDVANASDMMEKPATAAN
jgi:hypothetical protein